MRTIKELQGYYEFYSKKKDDFAQGFLDAIKCIVDGKNEEEWEWEEWFDEYETGFHECLEWYYHDECKRKEKGKENGNLQDEKRQH